MKKTLPTLVLFIIMKWCASQNVTLNFDAGYFPSGHLSGCPPNSICFRGPDFKVFGPNSGNTASIQMRATHGCVGSYPDRGLLFSARHQNNGTWIRGDGLLFAYNFIQGVTYRISAKTVHRDDLYDQYGRPYENNPSMQVRVTNTPQNGTLCTVSAEPLDIFSTIDPYSEFMANSPVMRSMSNNSFTFTAQQCYSYLWVASKPNRSGESDGAVDLHEISIEVVGSPMTLNGNNSLCLGTQNYNIGNVPPGASINWSVLPAGIVSSVSNGSQISLTKTGNGKITLQGNVTSCGVTRTVSMQIIVGIPTSTNFEIYSDGPNVCPNMFVDFGAFYNDADFCSIAETGATNVEWNISPSPQQIIYNSGNGVCGSVNNSGVEVRFTNQGFPYQANVKFRAQTTCGWSNWSDPYVVQIMQGGFCGGYLYTVSPNPATGQVTIQPSIEKTTKAANTNIDIKEIKLFDQLGNLKRQWTFGSGSKQGQISVYGLKTGLYTIEISDGKNREKQQLLVNDR